MTSAENKGQGTIAATVEAMTDDEVDRAIDELVSIAFALHREREQHHK